MYGDNDSKEIPSSGSRQHWGWPASVSFGRRALGSSCCCSLLRLLRLGRIRDELRHYLFLPDTGSVVGRHGLLPVRQSCFEFARAEIEHRRSRAQQPQRHSALSVFTVCTMSAKHLSIRWSERAQARVAQLL